MITFSFPIEEIANFMAYISWLKKDTINTCENLHLYKGIKTKVTYIKKFLYVHKHQDDVWMKNLHK
jgi:hypothetical protein